MRELSMKVKKEYRQIVLIVDNCTAHPDVDFSSIEPFLPPYTTSITQPMDAGIIKNQKLHYRIILAVRHLEAAETETDFKWNVLDAMIAMKSSWSKVNESAIRNCYRKCGFLQAEQND